MSQTRKWTILLVEPSRYVAPVVSERRALVVDVDERKSVPARTANAASLALLCVLVAAYIAAFCATYLL
jgi:hypothetical protein